MATYVVGSKAISIQSQSLQPGTVVGSGDVEKGSFDAAKGLEKYVELGHVIPRLADGRIVVAESQTTAKPKTAGKQPKKDAQS